MDIAAIRKEYTLKALDINQVNKDPIKQFKNWFDEALKADIPEPNAMNLATITKEGRPTSRIVLLKGIDNGQFVFYTNYQSRKGKEIASTPFVCINFFWPELERQVRIEGKVNKVTAATSDEYFNSRPKGSRIGAHVSPQSNIIADRQVLEQRAEQLENQFAEKEVPRPEHWGGYAIDPYLMEFWQGRASRLHDRIMYELEDGQWQIKRLAP
jgi:pyridoxamine 5'-phosphate oxidase